MTRRSLHLGVNVPDPSHYGASVPPLAGAEADAVGWHAFASARGWDAGMPLLGSAATTSALGAWVDAAVADDVSDVLLTWSGHGTQVPSPARTAGWVETDGLDETWALWDRLLLDDEVHALMARFASGTRVVVVADSCHSFGGYRFDPGPGVDTRVRLIDELRSVPIVVGHQALYDTVRAATPPDPDVTASVLGLAACAEDESALESDGRGHFSAALQDLMGAGFAGTYAELVAAAAARTAGQHPRAFWYGTSSPLLHVPAFG